MIGIFFDRCHTTGIDGVEIFILVFNHLVDILDALLIVSLAVVDGATPEIDIGQQSTHSIAGEIANVAPAVFTIGTAFHDVALSFFQVVDAILQHAVGSHLRNRHLLVVVFIRLIGVRNVAESTNEIEVAKAAQSKHLCTCLVIVTLCECGIQFHHVSCMVQHDVASVDNIVERTP